MKSVTILGHVIGNGSVRPDPERLRTLLDLPRPNNVKSLKRAVGMLSHYSKWIPSFSEKLRPLVETLTFPLSPKAIEAYDQMKNDIARASLSPLDDHAQFVVETDASDSALAATLSQNDKPIAFFSRTLNPTERHHSSIEKEAAAIVESIRRWRHFLIGRQFKLITDQKSVSFMFDQANRGKVKNDKIARWRLELASYSYEISYRPGDKNTTPDMISRADLVASVSFHSLADIHENLCHPGITRLWHFVKARNLPYALDDVRKLVDNCHVCARFKPKFAKTSNTLVKATRPFEKLSLDFKGPLPSVSKNKYLFVVIDEYSRFPFAFATPDTSSDVVIRCLSTLFAVFGMPECIHSDRGTGFSSHQFRNFLLSYNVAQTFTTPYNPQGNGQVERYNGVIWNSVQMACHSRGLKVSCWEQVLPAVLHSIRSLLCTSTNATPHERLFRHERRTATGLPMPTWLLSAKRALMHCSRNSKYDSAVQEVDILDLNPTYARVRLPSGREPLVSLRHLAPAGQKPVAVPTNFEDSQLPGNIAVENIESRIDPHFTEPPYSENEGEGGSNINREEFNHGSPVCHSESAPELRRSSRIRRPPVRFVDYEH